MNLPQFNDVQQFIFLRFNFSPIYQMNQQNYFEESQISLSAFLCLQTKNQPQFAYQSQTITPSEVVENNLACQQNEDDFESPSDQSSKDHSSQSKSQIGKSKKQKKQYSKNYRMRHKEYVKNLQITNQKLQKKVEELNLKIDGLTEEIQCLKYGRQMNDHLFDNHFMRQKQNNFKKLVSQAETHKKPSWDEIKEFADYYGFAGKQKINLLNYYMSQIMDNLLTDHLKNFILGGLENFEITKPYAQTMYEKQREIIGASKSNFNILLKYLRKCMPQRIKKFHKSGKDFYDSYVNLMNETKEIENHFSSIEQGVFKILPADKYLAVLKWWEENKYCKQIQLLRKDWFESFRQK